LLVGGASGVVHRRRLADGSDAGDLGTPASGVDALALWGPRRELVIARHDRSLERWDADALSRTSAARTAHLLERLVPAGATVLGAWVSWGIDEVDPHDGELVRTLPASEGVEAILVDDETIYTAGWDDRITAHDRRGRGEARPFELEPDGLVDLVQPAADTLISAGRDGAIAIWDAPSGKVRHRLRGHDFGVEALAVGGGGRWLASVSLDGTLRTWDLHAPPIDRVLAGAGDKIQALAFDVAGDRVIAAIGPQWGKLDNDAVRAWSVADGRATTTTTDHAVTVDAIAVAPDGKTIVTASRDGVVHVRDVADLSLREQMRDDGAVTALAFVDEGAIFVSAGASGSVAWWNTDGTSLGRTDAGVGAIATATFTGERIVVGGDAGLAALGAARGTAPERVGDVNGVTALASLPDGAVAVGHGDGLLARVDLATATTTWSAPTFGRTIHDVAVSPDGRRIATANQDYRIRLHDAGTGEFLVTVGVHESVATSVEFSPDGRTIASGGYDRVVRLWHAPTVRPEKQESAR
jgi:WD40 repeat protein